FTSQSVQRYRYGDRVEPGRDGGLTAERAEPVEGADERLLGEFPGELVVPGHAVAQAVDTIDVHVVELALGGRIPAEDAADQETFVPPASRDGSGAGPMCLVMGHGDRGKGCIRERKVG